MKIRLAGIALLALFFVEERVAAQSYTGKPTLPIIEPVLPKITEMTVKGKERTLAPDELSPLDIALYQHFQRNNAPDEIIALERYGIGLGIGGNELIEVVIRAGKAELRRYPDDCPFRYFHRDLSDGEIKELRQFITDKGIDKLSGDGDDCIQDHYYVHLTPRGGLRLRMRSPFDLMDTEELPTNHPSRVYAKLVELFARLADPERLQIRYFGTRLPVGLEVLFAHPNQEVYMVWTKGDDVRVLVCEPRSILPRSRWRSLRNGKLGMDVEAPEGFPPPSDRWCNGWDRANSFGLENTTDQSQPWQTVWGKKAIRGGCIDEKTSGTWICEAGKRPKRLFDVAIEHQLVSPDGHWLVGTLDKNLVCYDLVKRAIVRINGYEPINAFEAIYYLPVQKQVLLLGPGKQRLREPLSPGYGGWLPATYRLLDPATGKTREVEERGDLGCLRQSMHHPFQPTDQSGVIWIANSDTYFTWLGRFDTKLLRFRKQIIIDLLQFDGNDFWIDEPAKKIYVVFRGHLLRFPLPESVLKDWPKGQAWRGD